MNPIRIATLGVLLVLGSSIASAEQLTLTTTSDTNLRQDQPNTTFASNTEVLVGQLSGTQALRGLLTFDLSAVPENAVIESVQLVMRQNIADTNGTAATVTLNVHLVTEAFVLSQASWNNRQTGTAWSTSGGTFDSSVLTSTTAQTKPATLGDITWGTSVGFVSAVQGAYDQSGSISFLLKSATEGSAREIVRLASSENAGGFDPQLIINYASIPEPSTLALLLGGAGLIVSVGVRRRR